MLGRHGNESNFVGRAVVLIGFLFLLFRFVFVLFVFFVVKITINRNKEMTPWNSMP